MNTSILKEACIETLEEAIIAEQLGANRLEVCSSLQWDGLTPSFELVKSILESVKIPVKVMIRPRKGNFIYTWKELNQMKSAILNFYDLGINQMVTGILTSGWEVDLERMDYLCKVFPEVIFTFHKAIDHTKNPVNAVNDLKAITNIQYILTSGSFPTAETGITMINKMIQAGEETIKIIAAGSITKNNLSNLCQQIHTNEFHGRRIVGELK